MDETPTLVCPHSRVVGKLGHWAVTANESEDYDKLVRQTASPRSVIPHVSGRDM